MGFRGIRQELIKSYLQNRTQCVKVNGTKSQPVETNLGVPKGLILVPLLFILYINYPLKMDEDLSAYADDSIIKINGKTWVEVAALMRMKLNVIFPWLHQNKLILNVEKSVFITFGN